jgi:hypothetical protein
MDAKKEKINSGWKITNDKTFFIVQQAKASIIEFVNLVTLKQQ